MAHALNATHYRPARGRPLTDIFSLIGAALRMSRAIESGKEASDADLRTLGVKRDAFERIAAAQRGLPFAD